MEFTISSLDCKNYLLIFVIWENKIFISVIFYFSICEPCQRTPYMPLYKSKWVNMQKLSYENVFDLQVDFHANQTHFHWKGFSLDYFWNRGIRKLRKSLTLFQLECPITVVNFSGSPTTLKQHTSLGSLRTVCKTDDMSLFFLP